eukprot:TRINITY_DN999_c0_g1_i3.p1 TRINITY_DN999_c0_g1~~TRINITY_DN999_c0_g1_i3.p1  ORF type:complete len:679 (-),score=87.66 TRINITY_DN999_c0_g1_i3:160-2196(-)
MDTDDKIQPEHQNNSENHNNKLEEENAPKDQKASANNQNLNSPSSRSSLERRRASSSDSSDTSDDEKNLKRRRKKMSSSASRSRSRSSSKSGKRKRSVSKSHSNENYEHKQRGKGSVENRHRDKKSTQKRSIKRNDKNWERDYSPHDSDRGHKRQKDKRKKVFVPGLDGPLLSYREFMELQSEKVDSELGDKIYNKYKRDYEQKQREIFYQEHKNDEWFKEKYDPILSQKFKDERKEEAQAIAQRFFKNFDQGIYNQLNLEVDDDILKNHFINAAEDNFNEEDLDNQEFKAYSNVAQSAWYKEVIPRDDFDITGPPYHGFNANSMTLFIKTIPKHVSRWDIKESLIKVPGFISLSLSEPLKSQEYTRFGWVLFDTEENCNKAASILSNLVIRDYQFTIVKSKSQLRPIKVITCLNKERFDEDLKLSRELISTLDKEKDITINPLLSSYFHEKHPVAQQFDLQILYLRKVHSYCYYSASEYLDERMLTAKCGPIILRHKHITEETKLPDIPDWHRRMKDSIQKRIQESQKIQDEQTEIEEINKKIEEAFSQKIEQIDEKFKCPYCEKYFAGAEFVLKHIRNKHENEFSDVRKKLLEKRMLRNYTKDPNKIVSYPVSGSAPTRYNNRRGGRGGRRRDHGGRSGGGGKREQDKEAGEYQDLDDPKKLQQRDFRLIIDYGDL